MLGSAASSMAATAAVVNLNNYDANFGITGVTDVGNTWVELLASTDGSTWTPVQIKLDPTATKWQLDDASGFFDAQTGVIPGATPGANVTFQLKAWTGGTSYGDSLNTLQAESAQWSQATGSWVTDAQPPATPPSVTLALPGSFAMHNAVVPEPSTIALGLLGAGALLIRRRK
jgi:hypothetical protein